MTRVCPHGGGGGGEGGTPILLDGGGVGILASERVPTLGRYPHPLTRVGTPSPVKVGSPPPSLKRQSSTASTCYEAGGLAFTQDFLVLLTAKKMFEHYVKSHQILEYFEVNL